MISTGFLFGMTLSELNKGSKDDLMKISGVGEKKAEAIIAYRTKTPFKSVAEVQNVKGIGVNLGQNIEKSVTKKTPKSKKETTKKETKSVKSTKEAKPTKEAKK